MKHKSAPSRGAEPALARKNMDMDVAKLEAVRAILGARTDTETVDRALDYVIFQGEVSTALENLYDLGGLDDRSATATPTARRKR
ncbi:MAG: hypothetical protein ABIT20_12790 [Gemmatimonadaceae bacterium]